MTAIVSGCSICEPAPQANESGTIPATAAIAVITIGRSRRRARATKRLRFRKVTALEPPALDSANH